MISHVNVLTNPKRNEKSSCPIRRQEKNLQSRPTAENVSRYKSFGLVEKWGENLFVSCFIYLFIYFQKWPAMQNQSNFNTQLKERKRLFSPKELPRTFQLISNTNWVGWSPWWKPYFIGKFPDNSVNFDSLPSFLILFRININER